MKAEIIALIPDTLSYHKSIMGKVELSCGFKNNYHYCETVLFLTLLTGFLELLTGFVRLGWVYKLHIPLSNTRLADQTRKTFTSIIQIDMYNPNFAQHEIADLC